ncbi:DUF1674 domain-containing protein [Granulosicoccaceae sp. 1_MG-2023]|nr:DUF1674 domain-containing protein [Granulosicoccaceae sp. 1_MG-2023]
MSDPQDNKTDADSPQGGQHKEHDTAVTNTAEDKGRDGSREVGGPKGLEPTRYGDWEKAGRCIDF